MKLRCRACQHILGDQTDEGLCVRQECHDDLLIEGLISIKCSCGYLNILVEKR